MLPVAGSASLTACGSDEPAPEAIAIAPTAPEEPDENVLDEFALIGAYLGTIAAFAPLRGSLTAILEQHRAHARELGASDEDLAAIEPIPPQALDIKEALSKLIQRERNAANQRADSADAATDPERIRELTFIAASEASHVTELRDVRQGAKR